MRRRDLPLNAPWLVAVVTFLLYLATLSRHYSGDTIGYALAVELGDPAYLLDPYHPLLHPLGWATYRLWQLAGWAGSSLLPLQVLNALGGAIAAGLVAAIAGPVASYWLALLAGLGFAVSGGAWLLGTDAEFVTIPLAAALLVLAMLLLAGPRRAGRASHAGLLGVATGVAILTYVSNALLVPVILVGLALDRRLDRLARRRQALVYLATVLLVAVPAMLAFLALWSEDNWGRVSRYFGGGGLYGQLGWFNLPHGGYAFLRSLALYPGLGTNTSTGDYLAGASLGQQALFVAYYLLVLAVVLAPVVAVIAGRRRLWPTHRRLLAVLATWSALYAAFAVYWVPGDLSFWSPVLAAWWLLVALVLSNLAPAWLPANLQPATVLAAAVALLAVVNALFVILPQRDLEDNELYRLANTVAGQTEAGDLIITRGDDAAALYLVYFAHREVATVAEASGGLDAVLDYAGQLPGRRVLVADSDPRRLARWQELLTGSGWRSRAMAVSPEEAVLLELAP